MSIVRISDSSINNCDSVDDKSEGKAIGGDGRHGHGRLFVIFSGYG